jgi:transposase
MVVGVGDGAWDDIVEQLDPSRWATLAEAAAAGGVSRSTLRSWYRAGKLESRLVPGPNGPQREVPLSTVLSLARVGERLGKEAMDPAAAVRALEDALLRAEHRADRAEAALRAALERAARAEARLSFRA